MFGSMTCGVEGVKVGGVDEKKGGGGGKDEGMGREGRD